MPGRVNQKQRTDNAIPRAAVELMRAGQALTMPELTGRLPVEQ
jgi:hypothetical protein